MLPQPYEEQEEPPDPGSMLARAQRLVAGIERAAPELMRRAAGGDGNARALLSALVALRDFTAKVDASWFAAAVAAERDLKGKDEEIARLRAELSAARSGQRSRRGRHSGTAPLLNVVRGAVPAGVLGALAHHGTRHAASAVLTGAAAASVTAGVVMGVRALPEQHPVTLPPAAAHQAVPSASSSPPGVVTLFIPAPKGKHHRRPHPALLPPAATPPASPALPSSPPPGPGPSASPGTLDVQQAVITLRPSPDDPSVLSAQVVIEAAGGPVSWSASASGLHLDAPGGVLQPGQVQVITVSVPLAAVAAGQTWTVTLEPGGQPVTVSVAA